MDHSTSHSPAAAGNARYDALEAFRAIGALMIVLFHAYQHSRVGATYVYESTPLHAVLRNLDSGVALFMALSGFVVFLPLARACVHQDRLPSMRGFLIRRAIRILPLYWIAIVLIWTIRYPGGWAPWIDLLEHLTFTQVFDSTRIFWTIGPAWSLAVEVQFYLAVALCTPSLYRLCSLAATPVARARALLAGIMTLIAASIAYKFWAFDIARRPELDYAVYYGLPAKIDLLACGMLLAVCVALPAQPFRLAAGPRAALWLSGGALAAMAFGLRANAVWADQYFHTLCGIAALCWLCATVADHPDSRVNRALRSPAATLLGTISYSVYLWHEPILIALSEGRWLNFESAAAFPLAASIYVALVVLAGVVSFAVIEYPTQHLRFLFTRDGRLAERYAR